MIKRAVKRLGQNFLKDARALERIASSLEIGSEDVVIEIGPGHGELTRRLLGQGPKKLLVIEKDPVLVEHFLNPLVEDHPNLEVVSGDALKILPKLDLGKRYSLAGNIPYYITGALLRLVSELEEKPETVVLTLQKEVADRLVARPPKMNLLAASVGVWGDAEIVRYISKKSFKPQPKVHSATVKIVKNEKVNLKNQEGYYKLVKSAFKQPRKTLLNNLKSLGATSELLKDLGFKDKIRPQDLSIKDLLVLSSVFTSKK